MIQVLNLGERTFHVSGGVLRQKETILLPEREAKRLAEMFKEEIKLLGGVEEKKEEKKTIKQAKKSKK